MTTYKAAKVASVGPTDHAAIFGIGGLGHLAVQYARTAGGFVTAVDLDEGKLEPARELGADRTVNATAKNPAESIRARRRECGHRAGRVLAVLPPGLRQPAPRRTAGLLRAARRRHTEHPDLSSPPA